MPANPAHALPGTTELRRLGAVVQCLIFAWMVSVRGHGHAHRLAYRRIGPCPRTGARPTRNH